MLRLRGRDSTPRDDGDAIVSTNPLLNASTPAKAPAESTGQASIPLAPFGTFGLDPTQMVALPDFVIPQPAGVGSLSVLLPNLPGLAGVSLYAQALVVQHPVQNRLTNVTADVIVP